MRTLRQKHVNRFAVTVLISFVVSLCIFKTYKLAGGDLTGASGYESIARNLVENGMYSHDGETAASSRLPIYVAVVAIAKVLAGMHWSVFLIWIQGLMAILTGFLWYQTALRLASKWWVPCLVILAYASHVSLQTENLVLRETSLYCLLIAGFFNILSREEFSRRSIVVLTGICVVAYLTRPSGFLLILPLVTFVMLLNGIPMTNKIRTVSVSLVLVAIAISPWQIYQSVISDAIVLAPTPIKGRNLYKGNSILFENIAPYVDVDAGTPFMESLAAKQDLKSERGMQRTLEVDQYLYNAANSNIKANPAKYMRKVVLRTLNYLSPLQTPLGSAEIVEREGKLRLDNYTGRLVQSSNHWLPFVQSVSSFYVVLFAIPLGLIGNILYIHRKSRILPFAAASLIFVLANIGVYSLVAAETRYRLYLDPLLILWACLAVEQLTRLHSESAQLD